MAYVTIRTTPTTGPCPTTTVARVPQGGHRVGERNVEERQKEQRQPAEPVQPPEPPVRSRSGRPLLNLEPISHRDPAFTGTTPPRKWPRRNLIIVAAVASAAVAGTGAYFVSASNRPHRASPAELQGWYLLGGSDRLDALSTDLERVTKGADRNDFPYLRAACVFTQPDVAAAQAYAPIPDAAIQKAWAAALDSYSKAMTDCIAGADKEDPVVIGRMSLELSTASSYLRDAAAQIDELSRSAR